MAIAEYKPTKEAANGQKVHTATIHIKDTSVEAIVREIPDVISEMAGRGTVRAVNVAQFQSTTSFAGAPATQSVVLVTVVTD